MDTLGIIEKPFKNVSYLSARDPSILTWGGNIGNVRQKLALAFTEKTSPHISEEEIYPEDDGLLQVYLRIKKAGNFESLYEIVDDESLLCKVPPGAQCIRNMRDGEALTKVFKFSRIFGPKSTQLDLFNCAVKAKVLRFINGFNCSLLTYGASGSGKTFTIIGTPEQPGIVPQALEYMFRTLPNLSEHPRFKPTVNGGIVKLSEFDRKQARQECLNLINVLTPTSERFQHTQTYRAMQARLSEEPVALITEDISHVNLSIWVSFSEIYNEYVFDLLKGDAATGLQRKKLRLGNYNGEAYIKDLKWISVSSGLEAYHVLQYGLHNLNYAATTLNDHSSRSHSIFSIKLVQASEAQEGVHASCFNFCDLAGSERIKKTKHVGDRLKESNNINTSLLVLGRCITLVRESQKRNGNVCIPFRESKLTQLFQRALQGLEAISMIVNINPSRDMFDESQHVLNFSAIAKDVILDKQQDIPRALGKRLSGSRPTTDVLADYPKLAEEVETLYDEIEQMKLDHEEDRQSLINYYKNFIDNVNKQWQERIEQFEELMLKRIREEGNDTEPQPKKRKISIIDLDSSEEGDQLAENSKSDDIIRDLKCQIETLSVYKEKCPAVEAQVKVLESENFKLKEQIVELEEYIEAIQQHRNEGMEEKESNNFNSCEEDIVSGKQL